MPSDTVHRLSDDLPKKNPWLHDRLGYAPFAKRLARVILSLNVPHGYVVGLHGQWGSGKSTILNFVQAHLSKHNQEVEDAVSAIKIIEFRPWIVAGHQDLISAFFKVLAEGIAPKETSFKVGWRRFLRSNRTASDEIIESLVTIAVAIDPTSGFASRFAGSLAKKSVTGVIEKFTDDPSLQAAHSKLAEQLKEKNQKLLIIIDDIDRLPDEEVRLIMQMVKTVGRLPNTIYLLAYDRRIVWRVLDGEAARIGPRYAEKIVQQEVELPKPSKSALLAMLDEEISFLTVQVDETTRWAYLLRDGVYRWVESPRDVFRLSNAIKFSWPALEGELDAQDLLAMEGLRLFDEAAFDWLKRNRDLIFSEGYFRMTNEEVKKATIDKLKSGLNPEVAPRVLRVVSTLFPQLRKLLEETFIESEPHLEIRKRRGIGSAAGYDAYFALHPSYDYVPKAIVDAVASGEGSADELAMRLRSYICAKNSNGVPMVVGLLDELQARFSGQNPLKPNQNLLDALFSVGEEVLRLRDSSQIFVLSPRAQLSSLIRDMLIQWGVESAGSFLLEAFEKSDSPAFCADVYVSRGRELGIFDGDSREPPCITMGDFKRLGGVLLPKIEQAKSNGLLESAPFFFDIIRAWAHLAGIDEPKAWIARGIAESSDFMVKVSIGLLTHSVGTKERSYTMRNAPDQDFYDLGGILKSGKKHLADSKLGGEQRSMLTAVVSGVERIQAKEPLED